MSKKLSLVVNEGLNKDLESVCEKNSLSKSEIIRRGILEQIRELEGDINGQ